MSLTKNISPPSGRIPLCKWTRCPLAQEDARESAEHNDFLRMITWVTSTPAIAMQIHFPWHVIKPLSRWDGDASLEAYFQSEWCRGAPQKTSQTEFCTAFFVQIHPNVLLLHLKYLAYCQNFVIFCLYELSLLSTNSKNLLLHVFYKLYFVYSIYYSKSNIK